MTELRAPAAPVPPAPAPAREARADGLLLPLVAIALLLGIARRACLGWDAPLSLDETWTGAIAAAPDLHTLLARCLVEVAPPVFYAVHWLAARVFGVSDAALRLPEIAAGVATPLLVLWRGHPERRVRLLWAGITALWLPGAMFAGIARPYGLAVLLATAQAIVLARLLRAPDRRLGLLWSGVSALLILTHYYALLLTATQLMAILARGRAAWRYWPALAPFLLVAVWMAAHLPTLLVFSAPQVAWYKVYGVADLLAVLPAATFGLWSLGIVLPLAIVATTLGSRAAIDRRDAAVALSGVAAVAIVALLATVRPSFSPRYLLPFAPALLFGVAVWGAAWSRRWPLLPSLLIGLFLIPAFAEARQKMAETPDFAHAESFEGASRAIAAAHPRRLIALFDGPATAAFDRAMLRDVAGFFLRRAGRPVEVATPALPAAADPNRALPRLADRPGDAILWIYDSGMRGTRGAAFPARIGGFGPGWRCGDYGVAALKVIACTRG